MNTASKTKRTETWSTIEVVQVDAVIEMAKRHMRGDEGYTVVSR